MKTNETFNKLVEEDPQAAAAVVVDGLRDLVNMFVPNVYVTKAEWTKLLPEVVKVMQAGGASSADEEDSDDGEDEETP